MISNTILPLFCIATCTAVASAHLSQYVETRIGTSPSETKTAGQFGKKTEEFGQCLPAVLEPHGMNFWTPQTRDTEKKCVAPYYYKDSLLQGFRNSHWIVGGCTQDYGSMTIMPLGATLKTAPASRATRFSHDSETTTPSYYSVYLEDTGIKAEMTGRSRSAIFRFTYDEDGSGHIVVNPNSDEGMGRIEIDTLKRRITGYNPVHRIYQGWGEPAGYAGYFVIEWPEGLKISDFGTWASDSISHGSTYMADRAEIGAFIKFDVKRNTPVVIKAASSFTDLDGAIANLEAEIPDYDFDKVHSTLTGIWENHLSSIEVDGGSRQELTKFYSALYRASFLPRTFNDCDGRYPAFSTGTPIMQTETGHNYYDDFSMWDTYRSLHPLLNIIDRDRSADMMNSLVLKYEQGGWLPIFPCWNSYTSAMIGDHCISALADAYIKGIKGFDIDKAYEAMHKNAFMSPGSYEEYKNGMGRRALESYCKYDYIPLQDSVREAFHQREQVSRTLEYAFDDFALAQVAKRLGKREDAAELLRRALNYRNVIDPATGYAQGRNQDGSFLKEPLNSFSFTKFITEGAPCHYSWYVPHDQYGLMEVMGGKGKYAEKLDSMFSHNRYWHGNEPCHQIAWLFNYVGQPWKTQQAVRHIIDTEYLAIPGGLSGNDDAGQMSAWYIFAALGFYPVCPATPYYVLGSPVFESARIKVGDGHVFTIIAHDSSSENIYITRALLDGKPYNMSYISHDDIMNGSTLELFMGPVPDKKWATDANSLPPAVM